MVIKYKENYCKVEVLTKDNITEICNLIKTNPLARAQDCTFEFICSLQEKDEVKELFELRDNNYIHTIGYINIGVVEDKKYFVEKRNL